MMTSQATTTTTGGGKGPLPAILCLHGGGSNSTVFKIQCRRLIWSLGSQFRFVFAQAPHEGLPGHGMLPVFESCAPFYRWVNYKFQLGESNTEVAPAEEVGLIDGILRRTMEEVEGGVESFVGVVGFSQGARFTAGLLLRQQMTVRDGRECWTRFRFGVMVGCPYPPISLEEGVDPEVDYQVLRTVPTVHAWGDQDFCRGAAGQLVDVCDGDVCYSLEFGGGHHMPLKDKDAGDLCDYIRAAWYAGGGSLVVGGEEKY